MATLLPGDGADGDIVISSDTNPHITAISDGRTQPDMCAFTVSAIGTSDVTLDENPVGLTVGDEVLLINLNGRPEHPAGSRTSNAGRYETFRITSIETNPNYRVYFDSTVDKFYGDGASDNLNVDLHPVMLQRIPNYNSFTVNNGFTFQGSAENAEKYGVMYMRVKNTCLVNGTISMSERGGIGGYGTNVATTMQGRGPGAGRPVSTSAAYSSGAGGHATEGQKDSANYPTPAYFWSSAYGDANLDRLSMGSGGGAERYRQGNFNGGTGGGALFIAANTIDVFGAIEADGGPGSGYLDCQSGSGAGGGVLLHAGTIYTRSGHISAAGNTAVRNGGQGRVAVYYNTLGDQLTIRAAAGSYTATSLFTDTELTLPYFVSGILSEDALVRIYDADTGILITTHSGVTGSYEIATPSTGPFDIVGKPVDTESGALIFRDVVSEQH